jgi:hypothetical protein
MAVQLSRASELLARSLELGGAQLALRRPTQTLKLSVR